MDTSQTVTTTRAPVVVKKDKTRNTHDELVPDGKNRRCQSREHKRWSCRVARPLWFRSRTCIILCYQFFIFIFIIYLHCHLFCTATCVVSICLFCMFVICSSNMALCLFSTRIHILFIYSQKHRHKLDSQRAVSIQLFIKQRNLKRQKKRSYFSQKHKKP